MDLLELRMKTGKRPWERQSSSRIADRQGCGREDEKADNNYVDTDHANIINQLQAAGAYIHHIRKNLQYDV